MSVLFEEDTSSLGVASVDPIQAGINATDDLRLASSVGGPEDQVLKAIEIEDGVDELLLPQNAPSVLKVAKSGAQILKESSGEKSPPEEKDLLTGEGEADEVVVGEVDSLTGGSEEPLGIQTRGGLFDGAGDNRRTALNIGILDETKSYSDSVSRGDRKDFYKFRITEKTDVEIELGGLNGNADLYLLNNRGKVIKKSKRGGKKVEEINRTLNPGIYYARVQSRNNRVNTDYDLTLETASESETLEKYEFGYYYSGTKGKTNQDYYNGYVYAPKGTYKVRSYYDFDRKDNEAGANGKYYISSSSKADGTAKDGEVYIENYYDLESGRNYTPYYASGDLASGTEGLGSEEDFIGIEFDREEDAAALNPQAFFGADNYAADIVQQARISGSGDYQIDALLSSYKWGTDTITYSFYDDNNGGAYYGAERGVREVSDKVKQNVRQIMENIYEPLLNVDFVEVADSRNSYGLIRIMKSNEPEYAYARYPYGGDSNTLSGQDVVGDVHLNPNYDGAGGSNNFQGGPGTHGYLTLIHELGHAVGLKHPGNYNGGGSGTPPFLPRGEDNTRNTVMSYNFGYTAETLMPYDVKALQYMYGSGSTESIAIAEPNGGNIIEPGENYTITWNDNISGNVKLELYKGGSFNSTINNSTSSDGSYVWRVPTAIADGSDYQIRISSVSDSGISDVSDSNFTIKADEPRNYITLASPNGGNSIEPGKSYTITWEDNISENVKLQLYKGGSFNSTINNSTSSDGSYVWRVPSSIADGSDYQVRITSVSDSGISDLSDSNFTIKAETTSGSIAVTSPNGGNILETGKSYNITWNDNISENVRIYLYEDGKYDRILANSTPSDGSYTWTVPKNLASSSDYTIAIQSLTNGSLYDFSDSNFTIQTAKPAGYITLTSPDGGNTLEPGRNYTITWNDNISENVKIELYKGGFSSRTISNSTSSDGSYTWRVPSSIASGSDYQVMITSVSDSSVYDYSNNYFSVEPKGYITVNYPNSGSLILAGETYNIEWNDNISENVKIELYENDRWDRTITSSTNSDGSYSWTVPIDLTSLSEYEIKIGSVSDSSVYDYSSYFNIFNWWDLLDF